MPLLKEILSPRELEMVALVSQGLSGPEAAAVMGVKYGTTKNYMRSVYNKTGLSNRVEVALLYVKENNDNQ
jgi:DNA-binding CsgD family transcriptional regulator